jgi:hypothetical protein
VKKYSGVYWEERCIDSDKIPEIIRLKKEGVFWLMLSVNGHMALLLWICGNLACHVADLCRGQLLTSWQRESGGTRS